MPQSPALNAPNLSGLSLPPPSPLTPTGMAPHVRLRYMLALTQFFEILKLLVLFSFLSPTNIGFLPVSCLQRA